MCILRSILRFHLFEPGRDFAYVTIDDIRLLVVLEMRRAIIPNQLLGLGRDRFEVPLCCRRIHAIITMNYQGWLVEFCYTRYG